MARELKHLDEVHRSAKSLTDYEDSEDPFVQVAKELLARVHDYLRRGRPLDAVKHWKNLVSVARMTKCQHFKSIIRYFAQKYGETMVLPFKAMLEHLKHDCDQSWREYAGYLDWNSNVSKCKYQWVAKEGEIHRQMSNEPVYKKPAPYPSMKRLVKLIFRMVQYVRRQDNETRTFPSIHFMRLIHSLHRNNVRIKELVVFANERLGYDINRFVAIEERLLVKYQLKNTPTLDKWPAGHADAQFFKCRDCNHVNWYGVLGSESHCHIQMMELEMEHLRRQNFDYGSIRSEFDSDCDEETAYDNYHNIGYED